MHHRSPRTRVLLGTAVAVTAALALTGPAGASPAPGASTGAVTATNGAVLSMSVVTPDDVWAAGYALTGDNAPSPLAEHWDGTAYRVTQTRLPADRPYGNFNAIDAVASDDVWAVGASEAVQFGNEAALIEHWNGKKWTIVPAAVPEGSTYVELRSVVAIAPDDVWAVGFSFGGVGGSLIEHWDGKQWSVVDHADPSDAFQASLQGVTAVSAKNVWATGFYFDSVGAGTTLVEHWNGRKWKLVDSPNVEGAPDTELHAVWADNRKDVWATGFYTVTGSNFLPLTEHWDGSAWSIVDAPNPEGSASSYLMGVSGSRARDVWATGYYLSGGNYHPFIEHWRGTKWKLVDAPDPGGSSYLFGVDQAGDDSWAAGFSFNGSGDVPYSEHWDGKSWNLVPLQ